MSTSYGVFDFVRLPSVMACAAVLVACATAWTESTSAGGDHAGLAAGVVSEVASATPMTPLCRAVGQRLVEVAVSSRVARLRPTASMMVAREEEAASVWEAARCPTPALVALVYGASKIASEDVRRRTEGSGG